MRRAPVLRLLSLLVLPLLPGMVCPDMTGMTGTALLATKNFATNTGGASAIAVRPSDGAIFVVSPSGLFGPIMAGDDVSKLTPFGATNLADPDLFDTTQTSFALAITNSGEFWIGSQCCKTLAVVPPSGGDAAKFTGLVDAQIDISPTSMVIVPSNFNGDEIKPGMLLVGDDTTFSRLAAIDVEGTRDVISVSNSSSTNRNANAMTFDSSGRFFTADANAGLTAFGMQQIATDGTPTALTGTLGVSANAFVVRPNGDFIIRGTLALTGSTSFNGLLVRNALTGIVMEGLSLATADRSADDDMAILSDGTILLTLPNKNVIVTVSDAP